MPLKDIFPNKTDDEPGQTFDEIVGRFRAGFLTAAGRPKGLSHWRVTAGDPAMLNKVIGLLGSADPEPSQWDTSTGENFQVFTETKSVDIIVDGPGSIRTSLVLWGRAGKVLETDGTYLIEDGVLTDKICDMTDGKSLDELKKAHRKGTGPGPSIQVYFRLADAPELGKFKFFSQAWTALEEFDGEADRMNELEGEHRYRLELEQIEFENDEGELVRYSKPRLTYLGPAGE